MTKNEMKTSRKSCIWPTPWIHDVQIIKELRYSIYIYKHSFYLINTKTEWSILMSWVRASRYDYRKKSRFLEIHIQVLNLQISRKTNLAQENSSIKQAKHESNLQ